ncbi:hypothetical protein DENSPDRAFT_421546 [Dentipellis sp. KUC8613]|nr:hypothetical protein DENSPDRAFT_421546 [Dentipellis sp. KUC8613]
MRGSASPSMSSTTSISTSRPNNKKSTSNWPYTPIAPAPSPSSSSSSASKSSQRIHVLIPTPYTPAVFCSRIITCSCAPDLHPIPKRPSTPPRPAAALCFPPQSRAPRDPTREVRSIVDHTVFLGPLRGQVTAEVPSSMSRRGSVSHWNERTLESWEGKCGEATCVTVPRIFAFSSFDIVRVARNA